MSQPCTRFRLRRRRRDRSQANPLIVFALLTQAVEQIGSLWSVGRGPDLCRICGLNYSRIVPGDYSKRNLQGNLERGSPSR
jgi:hypothetical protein